MPGDPNFEGSLRSLLGTGKILPMLVLRATVSITLEFVAEICQMNCRLEYCVGHASDSDTSFLAVVGREAGLGVNLQHSFGFAGDSPHSSVDFASGDSSFLLARAEKASSGSSVDFVPLCLERVVRENELDIVVHQNFVDFAFDPDSSYFAFVVWVTGLGIDPEGSCVGFAYDTEVIGRRDNSVGFGCIDSSVTWLGCEDFAQEQSDSCDCDQTARLNYFPNQY